MTARRRRVLWFALLALALGVGAWLARRPAAATMDGVSAPAASARAASALAAVGAQRRDSGSAPAVRAIASPAAATAPPVAAGVAAQPDEVKIPPEGVEFCGVRRVSADELRRWKADPVWGKAQFEALEAQMDRIGEAATAHIAARLAAGNDHQQVAARLLMQDREGAAALAERSSDALAYQMALSACAWRGEGAPHCARLTPRRWAELDPSDARPWLRMMDAAQRRKDAAGVDAALAEAAARPRLSRGVFLLEAQAIAVADAVPDGTFGFALMRIIGTDAAMQGIDLIAPAKVCNGEALHDSVRQGHCRALARQALANAADLSEAALAQKLADRAGVPREQQAHDAQTLKDAQLRFNEYALHFEGADCAAMRRMNKLSASRAASGELAMALALLPARQAAAPGFAGSTSSEPKAR